MNEGIMRRLQRQTDDAAQRLSRTTSAPTIALAFHDFEGGMGLAYSVHGPRMAQIELALFMLLQRLEQDLMTGAAEGCESCTAAYARVSNAIAALAPGFGPDAPPRGNC